MILLLSLLCSCCVLFYLWVLHTYSYWRRKNVFSPPATFPLGHLGDVIRKTTMGVHYMNLYDKYKDRRFVGLFVLFARLLLITDLDLIRNILSKDYFYFQGHGFKTDKTVDPLEQHLFNLEGDEWKRIRVKLTPTFTSSKMRYMFDTVQSSTIEMVDYINTCIKVDNVIDVREVVAKLGTDVIGSCAFGIQIHSFKNPNAPLRKIGKQVFEMNYYKALVDMIATLTPELSKKLKIARQNAEITNFFQAIVKDTVEYREKNNVRRNDFLQLLIDMMNFDVKSENHITLPELTAQAFVFFIGGYETSSTTSSFVLVELAHRPHVANKVLDEIEKVLEESEGKITYEVLSKMTYLTQVIEESLRLYPPAPFLFRTCTKDYSIPDSSVVIEKGTRLIIPTMGIQRDPDIYPDPLTFDPDRFSPENVKERHPYAHIPFGEGPRICIGLRFGMMQVKLALIHILLNFNLELTDTVKFPLEFDSTSFVLKTKGKLLLKLTRRANK